MSGQYDSLEDIVHFFGGDKKGKMFVQCLYDGTDYTTSKFEKVSDLDGTVMEQLLTAENHNKFEQVFANNVRQQNNDIHYSIATFIIRTALFHRLIDFPQFVGSNAEQDLNTFINHITDKESQSSMGMPDILRDGDDVKIAGGSVGGVRETLRQLIVYFAGDANTSVNPTADLAVGLHFTDPTDGFLKNIANTTDLVREIFWIWYRDGISTDLKVQDACISGLVNGFNKTVTEFVAMAPAVKATYRASDVYRSFVANCREFARESFSRLINGSMNYTTLENNAVFDLVERIYKNWDSMSEDAHKFYGSHLMFMASKNFRYGRGLPSLGNWVELPPDEFVRMFKTNDISDDDRKYLRVNIKKKRIGEKTTLFGGSLPLLPVGSVVWHKENGTYKRVITTDEKYLRNLYDYVYEEGKFLGTTTLVDDTLYGIEDFDLNYAKFISKWLDEVNRKRRIKGGPQTSVMRDGEDLDDVEWLHAYDSAYGSLWRWNPELNQYEKNINGKWTKYDTENIVANCNGSYLASGDAEKCKSIMICLAEGDESGLSRCLKSFEEHDIWEVARSDYENVSPTIIKTVFRKFNVRARVVRDENGVEIKVPMEYIEWLEKIVPTFDPKIKEVIMKNEPLKTYIRSLINIARENLSIFNQDKTSHVLYNKAPTYFQQIGVPQFRVPQSSTRSSFKLLADMLESTPIITGESLYNPLISGMMSNAVFVNQYENPFMLGGAPPAVNSSIGATIPRTQITDLHLDLFAPILHGLGEVGIELDGSEYKRIINSIKKLGEVQIKIEKSFILLKTMLDLARTFGIPPLGAGYTDRVKMKLKDVRSLSDMRKFISKLIPEITKKISSGQMLQNSLGRNLTTNIYRKLALMVSENAPSDGSGDGSGDDVFVPISE